MSEKIKKLQEINRLRDQLPYKELETALELEALPQEVFKHGRCSVQWQVQTGCVWSTAGTIYQWNARNAKLRAKINRGGVDFVYVSESEMPLNLRKKRNQNYAV